ncbi:hypothetical protein LSUB1_G004161 [Lachnellula subtilissima]|uniref:Uncharacterized protein n=1 Tax=Lachnellula subtilissima TaxID=602034 RepID=A0A8H8RM87_9HELO|nr:hypothetical protein LSUB1_G004161 [Lachnellula subtilissima]
MSGKGNSGSSSSSANSGSSSSGSNSYHPYTINSQGVNNQGASYDTRSQPSGEAYHYSNSGKLHKHTWNIQRALLTPVLDGSYYYSNGNNSTYYNNGQGSSTYTAPNGNVYKK